MNTNPDEHSPPEPAAPEFPAPANDETLADPNAARAAALEAEVATLKDQMLRALAEAENARRRAQRERDEAVKYAASQLARDLLNVADNLSRAREAGAASAEALQTGVELVERELLSAFEKHGIKKIVPMGERFDPNLHQAMFEVPSADMAPGTVVQVVQPGYVMAERLLRPALVGVAKAAPAAPPGASVDTVA